ncbi:class D beta-lactamase [Mesorhizobium sp. CAU 1741]|uniref:class D beta-lactamase n=1 Tax=Mesorhizobium sp. CAU 1741 TaxID=3140366 RepID=UPI00325BF138
MIGDRAFAAIVSLLSLGTLATQAQARQICVLVADAQSGAILHEDGDCRSRVTPASTFKVPLAVIGYDAGFLKTSEIPELPFKPGYPDWIEAWKQPTTPRMWMANSVVWYSQRITEALGRQALERYLSDFDYGNADFSGDAGRDNGLQRAWLTSSLLVSPIEQVTFMARLVNRQLPVSRQAMDLAMDVVESRTTTDGWTVHGKTGSAYPRNRDGSFNRARGWGWYVGWASQEDRTLVFARLDQDEQRHQRSGGLRARDAFIAEWPELWAQIGSVDSQSDKNP